MLPDPMVLSAQQRMQSYVQAAEEHRLLKRAARLEQKASPLSHIRWWMGTQLITWGVNLQRYHKAALPAFPDDEPCSSYSR